MFTLPPIPTWNAFHPIAVHFPIALIVISPLLVLAAMVCRPHTRGLLAAALVTAAVGALGAVVAAASGEAAAEAVTIPAAAKGVLEEHEEMGEMVRTLAIGLAVVVAVLNGIAWKTAAGGRKLLNLACLGAIVLSAPVLLVVFNAGHQGGRLVHEFGVHAPISGGTPPVPGNHHREED